MRASFVGCCCALLSAARPAAAYRPFDGTDASVAETGNFELELGPAHFYRNGTTNYLIAPATVLNLGVAPRFEVVLDAKDFVAESHSGDGSHATLQNTDLLLKWLAREGELQGKPGLGLAFEGGLLTPELGARSGFGAQLDSIVSKQWPALTLHFNEQIALTRDKRLDLLSGLILEAPESWCVRPVSELYLERAGKDPLTRSALLGLIWPAAPNFALDAGVRVAHENQQAAVELRLGFTWAARVWKPR